MEVTTLNEIISGSSMVLSALLGFWIKNSFEKEQLSQKAISQKIVTEVLAPLLDSLYVHNRYTPEKQVSLILEIVHLHRELIPSDVLECINSFLQNPEDHNQKDKLLLVAESYFNYYRKQIGYPYEPKKICENYIPTKSRNAILWTLWGIFSLVIFCGTAFIIVFASIQGIDELPSWTFLFVLAFLFNLPFLIPSRK